MTHYGNKFDLTREVCAEFLVTTKEKKYDFYVEYTIVEGRKSKDKGISKLGPLVIGFYLQVIGDGTIYMPLYKVENLYSHYSVLPSSLEIEGRTMDMQTHEAYSEQVAQQLIEKAYIPLQGEVTFENIKNGYERYFKNPNKGTIVEYEDYVYISSWTRNKLFFETALNTVYNELKAWPEERYFVQAGGFQNWILELEKKAGNHEILEDNYRKKIAKYKIEKLPERPFYF